MHFLNRVNQCKNPRSTAILVRVKSVALRHVDLSRHAALHMCCSNLRVSRPQNADRCWQTDGWFVCCSFARAKNNDDIYLPSQLYVFQCFSIAGCCSNICGNRYCHTMKNLVVAVGWWSQRGGCLDLMCLQVAKQWPAAQEWISPFRGWQNNSLPVDPVADTV